MKLGVHCANLTWPGGADALGTTLAGVARAADEGGVTTVTLMDHYFQMEHLGGPPEPMLEGYTSLGFLAGQTSRIELGLLVTGVTYRHPGLLAKIVTTLDVLSGGRAMLGLGAAWYEREHLGVRRPYPPTRERFERLEETLQIVQQAWGDGGRYDGAHYTLEDLTLVPQPIQPGGPRIVVGGTGERKTLRLVAQYAAACNLFATSVDEVAAQARRPPRPLRRRGSRLRRGRARRSSARSTVRSTTSTAGSPPWRPTPTSASPRSGSAPTPPTPSAGPSRCASGSLPRLAEIGG